MEKAPRVEKIEGELVHREVTKEMATSSIQILKAEVLEKRRAWRKRISSWWLAEAPEMNPAWHCAGSLPMHWEDS